MMANDGSQAVYAAELGGGMYGPNQYSLFPNGLHLSNIGYRGTPTDAMGNPIQPPPGMTLNSNPAVPQQQAAAPTPMTPQQNAAGLDALGSMLPAGGGNYMAGPGTPQGYWKQAGGGMIPTGQNTGLDHPQYNQPTMQFIPGQQQAAPQSAPQQGGSLQDAISLLSNPGKVNTPGATVPQSTIGSQPSVLQQFLANQHGGQGSNTYSNQGFFDTLNKLGG